MPRGKAGTGPQMGGGAKWTSGRRPMILSRLKSMCVARSKRLRNPVRKVKNMMIIRNKHRDYLRHQCIHLRSNPSQVYVQDDWLNLYTISHRSSMKKKSIETTYSFLNRKALKKYFSHIRLYRTRSYAINSDEKYRFLFRRNDHKTSLSNHTLAMFMIKRCW